MLKIKGKKTTFLIISIILGITIILGALIGIILFPNAYFSITGASAVATVTGGEDGPTTIYISAKYNWKVISIVSLLLLMLDFVLLAIIKIIEYKKSKKFKLIYKAIIILFVNLLFSIMLFPGMLVWSILIAAIMIVFIIFMDKYLAKKATLT